MELSLRRSKSVFAFILSAAKAWAGFGRFSGRADMRV